MRERLGPDPLFDLADAALGMAGADAVEARVTHAWGALARFASSAIHQHVDGDDTVVSVRVVRGERVGVASTNDATEAGVAATAVRALAAAEASPPEVSFPGLAGPGPLADVASRFDEVTAAASPQRRAQSVAQLLGALASNQYGAGALSISASEVALATTAGARHYGAATRSAASTVVTGGGATGHGEDANVVLDELDVAGVGRRAAEVASAAVDPVAAEPGEHDVVLMPSAVATLVDYLSGAFSGKAVAEGRSALSQRLGQMVVSPLIHLADNALDPGAFGVAFDGEGTPRQRVELLAGGRAGGVVHDRASAATAGTDSTGHGLAAPNPWGPMPGHLVLAAGESSVEDLIAGVERGLLVTRFWYTRPVNAKRTLVTGMTRDGTFRIEAGQLVGPVRNLRYNQSILGALATCDGVGDTLRPCSDEGSDIRVPALRLRSFNFTSSSDH